MSLPIERVDAGFITDNHAVAYHQLGCYAILARRPVRELQELAAMRRKGWDEDTLDDHFTAQREAADNADENQRLYWFGMMKRGMKELDSVASFVPTLKPIEFLDIGCAPGGFSSYILHKNRHANGIGITLPVSSGGHAFLLEERFSPRYELVEQDILAYDLSTLEPSDSNVQFPDALYNRFPLVMLDGHALRNYQHPSMPPPQWLSFAHATYRSRLLITQFIIALESVHPGGTIVAKLSHIECYPSAQLLYLLDELSQTLVVHKPKTMHSSRGTFYVIAKGVCGPQKAEIRERYLSGLKELWLQLTYGGPNGEGRKLLPTDLDFIVTSETILEEYIDRLIALGRGVWSTQTEGLRKLFLKKGIQ